MLERVQSNSKWSEQNEIFAAFSFWSRFKKLGTFVQFPEDNNCFPLLDQSVEIKREQTDLKFDKYLQLVLSGENFTFGNLNFTRAKLSSQYIKLVKRVAIVCILQTNKFILT